MPVDDSAFRAPESSETQSSPVQRKATQRHFLMCRPDFFTVNYSINPWMHPDQPTDTGRAVSQWEQLADTYRQLGHTVDLLEPTPGLVDMVFSANGVFTVDGIAYLARFAYPQRQPESDAYRRWFGERNWDVREPGTTNEGEGDFAVVGDIILAGFGYRSTRASHAELERTFGKEVLSLALVDPRFYHLDVALTVLDSESTEGPARIAYLPSAFDETSQAVLRERFPDSILVSEAEAQILALNSVSDGRNVVVTDGATDYIRDLSAHGYTPVPIDLSELLKGGGGIKCCTQELRTATDSLK